jgi:predicted  nucleic acid-binding Zn-ribbon protein
VNEQLRLLVELQRMDTEIIRRSRTIKAIPAKISTAEKPLKEAEKRLEEEQKAYQAAEKRKKAREQEVEEIEERVEKMKERAKDIKDNKAYQAHLKEIEQAEGDKFSKEDEILELMESLEAESAKVRAAEEALKGEEEKIAERKRELDAEVKEAEGGLGELKRRRAAQVKRVDPEEYDRYMTVMGRMQGLAVVRVEGEVCAGCNMNVMPQLAVEIRKGEEIFRCPQCGRILYYEADVIQATAEAESDTGADSGAAEPPPVAGGTPAVEE